MDARQQFERELNDPLARDELLTHNQLVEAVGNKLFEWYRPGKQVHGRYTPHLSFSTGFRAVNYNRDGSDDKAVVYALKSFPMNVFITPAVMRWMLVCVREARDEVLRDQMRSTEMDQA